MSRTQDEIRDRAYALWVDAGSPGGRDDEFWYQAEAEFVEDGDLDQSEDAAEVPPPVVLAGLVAQ